MALKRNQNPTDLHQWLALWESRTKYCPVREKDVQEYALPLKHVYCDTLSQVRDDETPDHNHVAALAGGFVLEGQKLGICVRLPKGNNLKFPLSWENHRRSAAELLKEKGTAIDGLPPGYVWASIYEELLSDLTFYQTLENNLHEIAKPADEKANLYSLKKLVNEGYLDEGYPEKFKDTTQAEQDRRLYELMDRCMPGVKKKSLARKWRNENKQLYKVWSKSAYDAKRAFHIKYGSQTGFDVSKTAGSNQVLTIQGKKVIIIPAVEGKGGGKYMESAHQARNVEKECDEVWFVAALPRATLRNGSCYKKPRTQWIEHIKKWNDSVRSGKVVDRIMFIPQNENENKQLTHWILDHRF